MSVQLPSVHIDSFLKVLTRIQKNTLCFFFAESAATRKYGRDSQHARNSPASCKIFLAENDSQKWHSFPPNELTSLISRQTSLQSNITKPRDMLLVNYLTRYFPTNYHLY